MVDDDAWGCFDPKRPSESEAGPHSSGQPPRESPLVIMQLTKHRAVSSVVEHFQAGIAANSFASHLLKT